MMDISTLNFGVWLLLLMQYIVEVIAMLHKIEVCFNLVEKSQLTSQSIISAAASFLFISYVDCILNPHKIIKISYIINLWYN